MNTYYAATKKELSETNEIKKLKSRFHIKNFFPHTGEIVINDEGINFQNWKSVKWNEIEKAVIENDDVVSSRMFATQSRLFVMESAKPIKLLTSSGENIYLYVNWNFASGLSANTKVLSEIKSKIS